MEMEAEEARNGRDGSSRDAGRWIKEQKRRSRDVG